MNGRPLVYLDTAASAQKPRAVIDALQALLRARLRQHPPRRVRAQPARHGAARRGAAQGQRFLNARRLARDRLRPQRHRGHQPRGAELRSRPRLQPGDEILVTEMEHHANIVPWQIVAAATGAKVVAAPITDARRARHGGVPRARHRAHADDRRGLGLERAGHDQPGARDRRPRPRARRAGPDRRGPGGAAPAGRRPGARRRLPRLLRPQALRALRRGRALRARPSSGGDAALPGRRRHDRPRHASPARPSTTSRSVSRPARPTSPASSPWVPPSTTSRASGIGRHRGARERASGLRARGR